MNIVKADRINALPEYLFARIDKTIAQKRQAGVDVINLGIGDPDKPTPNHVIEALGREAANPQNHKYPSSVGLLSYRQAVAQWYKERFGVELDPQREVVSLVGSKEGLFHISWCFLNPGDTVLIGDIHYPVYSIGAQTAGATPYYVPLKPTNNFLPDFSDIPAEVAKKAKLFFVNYPNNPTGAIADEKFYRELIAFARENEIIICHDAAYSEMCFDGYKPPSFLQFLGAKEVGVEFGSVSKAYNMTGWRIGWVVGNPEVAGALGRLKTNYDSGQFQAVQHAAIAGLTGSQDCVEAMRSLYRERRDIAVDALNELGWSLEKTRATFYIWAPVPSGYDSLTFAEAVLEKAGVVVTPGVGYGPGGEGFFRISLTTPTERLREAFQRIKEKIGKMNFR